MSSQSVAAHPGSSSIVQQRCHTRGIQASNANTEPQR
ncbi:hypothetical protein JaAD80_26595 [Janthinobacterium sp. AD80]|nr:hypothetical protein JaAD80_26595 [Janthinobacterium sp. AD80]